MKNIRVYVFTEKNKFKEMSDINRVIVAAAERDKVEVNYESKCAL